MKKILLTICTLSICATMSSSFAQSFNDLNKRYKEIYRKSDDFDVEQREHAASEFLKEYKKLVKANPAEAVRFAKEIGTVEFAQSPDGEIAIVGLHDGGIGRSSFYYKFNFYKVNGQWKVIDESNDIQDGFVYGIHQVSANNGQIIYVVFQNESSGNNAYHRVYTIAVEKGQLNMNAKYIKTGSGMMNKIVYNLENADGPDGLDLEFDTTSNSILMPLIQKNGSISQKKIKYTFNGKFFEKK